MKEAKSEQRPVTSILVGSSNGWMQVDTSNGEILNMAFVGKELHDIKRFDLKRFRKMYGELPSEIDILHLGYWLKTGFYESPELNFK